MSPSLPEILTGVVVAMTEQLGPESAGAFTQGRFGVLAMMTMLGAQEAERGPAATAWENQTLSALCREQAGAYDAELGGVLAKAAEADEGDRSLAAVTAVNAELRRAVTALHEAAERKGDRALDRRILAFYRESAARRLLHLPSAA